MYKVKAARNRQQVLCCLMLIFLPCCYSSGKLSIQLLDYTNAASRTYDGGCCDNIRFCVSSCDNFFILCLAGVGVTDKCSLYRRDTQVTSSDRFSFSTSLGNGLKNPVIYNFTLWQPLKFSVEVWDDDSSNFVGKDSDLIDRYTMNIQHSPSPNMTDAPEYMHRLTGRQSIMNIKVKVYCDDFYFTPNCTTYCKARDDSKGHYTCDYSRGRKVCREGWYGSNCLVYCQPLNDSFGHYICNEMGQKLCLDKWMGENCTKENSSNIHPSSVNSASIGPSHLSSISNGIHAIPSFPSFTSRKHHYHTETTTSLAKLSKSRNFYSSPISSTLNKNMRTVSIEIKPSHYGPILPITTSDNGPILQVSTSDNGPILQVTTSDNGPILPITISDNGPILPVSTSDNGPILQVSTSDNGPILPVSTSDNGPILQVSTSDNGPILPVSTSDNGPILPVSTSDNGPILPVSTSDNGPILPVSTSDNGPILPVSTSDNGPIFPITASDNGPILPITASDNGPILPITASDNGPILPVSTSDNGPILPVSTSSNVPVLQASLVSSTHNGPEWLTLSIDRNITSPTATVHSSHSTSINHTFFKSSVQSTKTTQPLGPTLSNSYDKAKVSSTITANGIEVPSPTDKALSSLASKESDCRSAALDDNSLKLIPVFMEIEMSEPHGRENVIARVKPCILFKMNEYCKSEREICNIPNCRKNISRVLFGRKQLAAEIINKQGEDQSQITLQIMAKIPGVSKGIVPPDVLFEILNSAVSDIDKACDVHVTRVWIEGTTDLPISGLLKNYSQSTSVNSRALTFIAVGACSIVAMVIVFGISCHRSRNIRSRRVKVNPLIDDDSTPPDSPDIPVADKTHLLRKQEFQKSKTSSQLTNEELELTSRIPGSVT